MPANFPAQGEGPSQTFIKNLEKSLIDRYRSRNLDYQTLVNAWHGVYYMNADMRTENDPLGRPVLRDQAARMENVPETMNVLKGFADAYKRMLVHLPDIRVPRPPGRFTPDLAGQKEAENYQARMKRAAYGIWDASQMDIQQVMSAFWLATCGSFGWVIVPDFERGHAVIKYVAPWDIYGVGKVGDDTALSRVIISVDQDVAMVQSTYGDKVASGGSYMSDRDFLTAASSADQTSAKNTIRHSIYLDEHYFVRTIGNKEVGRVKHDLGFTPAGITPFILLPQHVNRGESPIAQLLPMQLSINFAVTLWEEGFKDSVLPTTWVRNAAQIPANFARGRGQLISIGENGDIGELGGRSAEAMRTVQNHTDMMLRFMQLTSGVSSPQLEGRLSGGGPTTGRGLEKASGPYLAGVEEIQNTSGYFMGRALKMALDMTANKDIWVDEDDATKVCFYGTFAKPEKQKDGNQVTEFYEEFTREELRGVPAPDMNYSPLAHLGMGERLTMVLQMLGAKPPLISWDASVDMIGIVKDHPNMRAEIESDLRWRYQIMQQEVAAQTAQGAPPADALRAGASAAAGATNPVTTSAANVNPPTATPAGPIPGGGSPTDYPPTSAAPSGAPAGDGSVAPVGAVTLPPDVLAKMGTGAPQLPAQGPDSVSTVGGDSLKAELSMVKTTGDVLLSGNTVFVDWKDKAAVSKAVAHHKDVTVKVKAKGDTNVPKGAQIVATGRKGKKNVGPNIAPNTA